MNHVHLKEDRSLPELFSDLSGEMQRLIRDELALVKSEVSHKISKGIKDISFLVIGGAVIYAGLLAVIAAGIFLLGTAIALWLSALIIGILVLGIGYFMVQKGRTELKQTDFTPERTVRSLKEDKEWMKKRT